MNKIINGFLERNLPCVKDEIDVIITNETVTDFYNIKFVNDRLTVRANCYVSAIHGIYNYLKKICNVNLSWCGNRELNVQKLVRFDGEIKGTIEQKFRVYMNYCTLDYSMCWWDWNRWEKEIDFMAMNGINMPLTVIGTEAVWYETLLELGFSKKEALNTISGISFWAWQLMTNIEGYIPPENEKYVYERLELGKKILNRVVELGMYPIQQGFSGHVPNLLKEKFPKAKIIQKPKWCNFPKTAQLDPLDPLFNKFGNIYLNKLKELMGCHHYLACDPFHEGIPPKPYFWYLRAVGKAIDNLYKEFDPKSVWVMQSWSIRYWIATAVKKDRLLILDINSRKSITHAKLWDYPVVAGMLHNFGGKNAMQGKLNLHSKNPYKQLKKRGVNVVGSGMFMEGIEQNPVLYDLQFELLTKSGEINLSSWLDNYVLRRYGAYSKTIRETWNLLLKTCYCDTGYQENEVGSILCARPAMLSKKGGPCDFTKLFYNVSELEQALKLFYSVSSEFQNSDGYQYDLCDIMRQVLSNRFYVNQELFAKAYQEKNLEKVKELSKKQLDLLLDLDDLLSNRSEMCLSRWICDSHNLATDKQEELYYDRNARTLITLWGDVDGDTALFDYSWREWSGLIKEYYYVRWSKFYDEAIKHLESNTEFVLSNGVPFFGRTRLRSTQFGNELADFENKWCKTYCQYDYPQDKNVITTVDKLIKKWL